LSKRDEKRAKVTGKGYSPSKSKKAPVWVIPVALLVVLVGLVAVQTINKSKSTQASKVESANVGAVTYQSGVVVQQTPIEITQENSAIKVPLAEVQAKKLVGFTWKGQGKELPLLAYIAPSGKVVTAVSICEPCNGYTFHIENNALVCNTCGTTWDLENLGGVSGGCTKYPPDAFANKLEGDKIVIPDANVANWERRV
jgi:hypothetical protein